MSGVVLSVLGISANRSTDARCAVASIATATRATGQPNMRCQRSRIRSFTDSLYICTDTIQDQGLQGC